jgi:hypothetical protein
VVRNLSAAVPFRLESGPAGRNPLRLNDLRPDLTFGGGGGTLSGPEASPPRLFDNRTARYAYRAKLAQIGGTMNAFETLLSLVRSLFAPAVNVERQKLTAIVDSAPLDSVESLRAQLALAKLDAAEAKASPVKTLKVSGVKVSENGGLNIMGLRRFPVNLYLAELRAILEYVDSGEMANFISANRDRLSLRKVDADAK